MRILLAVDGTVASQVAVREVALRPWPQNAVFEVLSVADTTATWSAPELEEGILKASEEAARCGGVQLATAGLQSASFVLTGDPKAVVVDYASKTGTDLIVVGSHEESEVMRVLIGSVARAVVRHAHCSVEVVRPRPKAGAMKVLLASDGSECSEAAARSIAARPWPLGSEFRVLSVAELAPGWFRNPYPPYFDPGAMEDLRGEAMKKAQEAVMAAELILSNANLPESGTVAVPSASLKELILAEADEWGANLIVLGSHGRRGASRFLLGSVSEPVAYHAHCSVEIVR